MKPYGTYGRQMLMLPEFYGDFMDVSEVQDSLPKGFRIRNKKQKRRWHNKRTRTVLKRDLREQVSNQQ
ncbi:TPA: hypothetical protein PEP05_000806 [Vibrio parahaemolyticus]|nr:hypothetical protein [Vibrio parahaemolyticus]